MKKTVAAYVLFLLILFSLSRNAQADPVFMAFSYVPNDESEVLPCVHTPIPNLPDFNVICQSPTTGQTKTFQAHIFLRKGERADSPKSAIELLYSVVEQPHPPSTIHIFHTTTMLLDLTASTKIVRLVISQGVENDYASLRLELHAAI